MAATTSALFAAILKPGRTDRGNRANALAPCFVDHAGNCVNGPLKRRIADPAGVRQSLAQPRQLGAIGDALPDTTGSRAPMWNFTEFVPTSITA